jgi:hypothetical protein
VERNDLSREIDPGDLSRVVDGGEGCASVWKDGGLDRAARQVVPRHVATRNVNQDQRAITHARDDQDAAVGGEASTVGPRSVWKRNRPRYGLRGQINHHHAVCLVGCDEPGIAGDHDMRGM